MTAPMKSPSHRLTNAKFAESMSLTHLAHRWEISRREVRHLLQNGELPFEQIDGQLRVPTSAVKKYERAKKLRV